MSYLAEYTLGMDFIRERFDLPATVNMYEAVTKIVAEFKQIEEELQKSQKEKSCQTKQKKQKSLKSTK